MTAIMALASALIIGSSDFLLGLGARTTSPARVPIVSNIASVITLFLLMPFLQATHVSGVSLAYGALAGATGALGFTLYLIALRDGQMSIVAPITATLSAIILVTVGVVGGDQIGILASIGIVCAIVAGVLVSMGQEGEAEESVAQRSRSIYLAVGAGIVFSVFFWSLGQIPEEAGMWPLIAARGVSLSLQVALALIISGGIAIPRKTLRTTIPAGVLEACAVVLAAAALNRGPLSVAGVLTGLYPISTVLLAWVVLKERLVPLQWIAVALALAALPLTAL